MKFEEKIAFIIFICRKYQFHMMDWEAEIRQERHCELKDKIEHYYSLSPEEQLKYQDQFREMYLEMIDIEEWATSTALNIAVKHDLNLNDYKSLQIGKDFCA